MRRPSPRRLVEQRDRWLNPREWVEWFHEPASGFPLYPIPRDNKATKAYKERTLAGLYNSRPQWLADGNVQLGIAVAAASTWCAGISDDDVLHDLVVINGTSRRVERAGYGATHRMNSSIWERLLSQKTRCPRGV